MRFRQCLIEYSLPENGSQRPLWNALKYATSFAVIFLSAAQRLVVMDLIRVKGTKMTSTSWHGEHALFRLWQVIRNSILVCSLIERRILAAVVNSLYSFWWDVTNDWGLDLMKFDASNNRHSNPKQSQLEGPHSLTDDWKYRRRQSCYGLRSILLYPRAVYPAMIFLNLILRMTWSIRLSTDVHATRDGTLVLFWLEIAEWVRRWLWVFVRVEWEVIKRSQEVAPLSQVDDRSENEIDFEMVHKFGSVQP